MHLYIAEAHARMHVDARSSRADLQWEEDSDANAKTIRVTSSYQECFFSTSTILGIWRFESLIFRRPRP